MTAETPNARPTRRQVLLISAATAASTALSGAASALAPKPPVVNIRKFAALGSSAEIRLANVSPSDADRTLDRLEREVARLEAVFSIYQPSSAVSELNRRGRLSAPPLELVELLSLCQRIHEASKGLFDPTVQPLWEYYAARGSEGGIRSDELQADKSFLAAREKTGLDQVRFSASEVHFVRPGMKLTFNGIAQGYVTDRITKLLKSDGYRDVLVNIGEISALGAPEGGEEQGWPVTLQPVPKKRALDHQMALKGRAVATSARSGMTFDRAGNLSHILDPLSGLPVLSNIAGGSVMASSAALADGLSTTAVSCGSDRFQEIMKAFSGVTARLARTDGSVLWLES